MNILSKQILCTGYGEGGTGAGLKTNKHQNHNTMRSNTRNAMRKHTNVAGSTTPKHHERSVSAMRRLARNSADFGQSRFARASIVSTLRINEKKNATHRLKYTKTRRSPQHAKIDELD